ncbi:DUF2330 domain-containing protein [Tumidithrix elongata RA019]|uniref:DUF2330 domain-containing protein n=1 Tax=Tumidithrix elongata BACA0141 TaxID=2716417 RepID=A0AAW9Q533_9CYAN|nr:DUF2330 domain-containing protein [Tumidithrix elongata RA019]
MKPLRILISLILTGFLLLSFTPTALAFCGFYVAKADSSLYNKASQVVIARDGDRTILTMSNDYQGEMKDFALVVPVPVVLKQEQVRIGESKVIQRLDAFSAPRLVEYFDSDPCMVRTYQSEDRVMKAAPSASADVSRRRQSQGVTIEEQFTVGEYDILILSAEESDGLESWLTENGYRIPKGAKDLLQPYILQKMKFFVAKVNLKEQQKTGSQFLRPIMMAFESPRFMLPIRLGMVNAQADQDLLIYVLSPKGQADLTNYRMVKIPSGDNIPTYVKGEFANFYKSMFQTSYDRENRKVAFLEYAWDMSSCDPCSADPLTPEELRQAGVFWLDSPSDTSQPQIMPRGRRPRPNSGGVFISRIHVRYTRDKFPEDLMFKETTNREQFQGRYVMNHPFTGDTKCEAGLQYKKSLPKRFEGEAQTLSKLTGWQISDIRKKMNLVEVFTPTSTNSSKTLWSSFEDWWQDILIRFVNT